MGSLSEVLSLRLHLSEMQEDGFTPKWDCGMSLPLFHLVLYFTGMCASGGGLWRMDNRDVRTTYEALLDVHAELYT